MAGERDVPFNDSLRQGSKQLHAIIASGGDEPRLTSLEELASAADQCVEPQVRCYGGSQAGLNTIFSFKPLRMLNRVSRVGFPCGDKLL